MKKVTRKHEAHYLTYAPDSDGCLWDVDNVPNGNECGCFCPACREPLMAKNQGTQRMHHFAHQSGSECKFAYESMLHLLAKERIQEAFCHNEALNFGFQYQTFCPKHAQCRFVHYDDCGQSSMRVFNIKKYYDSCEQERPYDTVSRRSSLKFFSSAYPERAPLYFEFCATHTSDPDKLSGGSKIVEIILEDESDIRNIVEKGAIEEEVFDFYGESIEPKISFFGFKKEGSADANISNQISFVRYILYASGKTQCFQDECDCKDLKKSKPYSLLEMAFHTDMSYGIYDTAKYIGYQKFRIPNCLLCSNYVTTYYGDRICRLYKHLRIPRDEKFDTARAKTCSCFTVNQSEMTEALKTCDNSYEVLT